MEARESMGYTWGCVAYMGDMYAYRGEHVSLSCVVKLAVCSTETLNWHSCPIVLEWGSRMWNKIADRPYKVRTPYIPQVPLSFFLPCGPPHRWQGVTGPISGHPQLAPLWRSPGEGLAVFRQGLAEKSQFRGDPQAPRAALGPTASGAVGCAPTLDAGFRSRPRAPSSRSHSPRTPRSPNAGSPSAFATSSARRPTTS